MKKLLFVISIIVAIIRKQPDVNDGEIAAVLIDNEATLKRVYKKNIMIPEIKTDKTAKIS